MTTTPCNNCGTQTCTTSCQWSACNLGSVDGYESNDSQSAAYNLGEITDNDAAAVTIQANINPATNVDWFKIHVKDTFLYALDPQVTLSGVPAGMTYKLCVKYVCDQDGSSKTTCANIGSAGGSVSHDVGGCASIWEGDNDSVMLYVEIAPVGNGSCQNYTLKIRG